MGNTLIFLSAKLPIQFFKSKKIDFQMYAVKQVYLFIGIDLWLPIYILSIK